MEHHQTSNPAMEVSVESSVNGKIERAEEDRGLQEKDGEESVLRFLDSLDGYLAQLDALSSNLRQGWLDLASARHSMGSSRISSALFDLNVHSAATTVQVNELLDESPSPSPNFVLSKWCSLGDEESPKEEEETTVVEKKSNSSQLRHRGQPQSSERPQEVCSATQETLAANDTAQRERSKSLSVFGTLVSPKLRAAQVSFETALELIIEIANARSSMLSAYSQLHQEPRASS